MKVFLFSAMALLALPGCASRSSEAANGNQGSLAGNAGAAAGSATSQTREGFADAALTPLEDFNLRRRPIPPLLAQMDSPYEVAVELDCGQIAAKIAELDEVLGRDWDAPEPDERLRTEILADEAADATLGVVRSGATGWIPFRGLIRKATGAESHEKKYNRAYRIGAQKRAYLKGYGLARQCDLPARPDFETLHAKEDDAIVYKQDMPVTSAPPETPID
ncbi:MAG: hypothetical protein ACK4P2_06900 [Hyphomonas sp.]